MVFGLVISYLGFLAWHDAEPRVRQPSEVPIAFWAWRDKPPTAAEIDVAFETVGAKTLFLRSGQFDLENGEVRRIRGYSSPIAAHRETHLVYNATRRFLQAFESIDNDAAADAIAAAFDADVRASADGNISGLQLDLDVPTRLLPKYGELLAAVRKRVPAGTRLSMTGLASWVNSPDIETTLANVDLWIPQCYGTAIPLDPGDSTPISSVEEVTRTIDGARRIGKPFFAGLSSYGYAILYSRTGELLELRGDIDPADVRANGDLRRSDRTQTSIDGSGRRPVYVAVRETVLDGITIRPGESLVIDEPSAALLRATAEAVRRRGGEALLGIAVFRLPTDGDMTSLTVGEVADALNGRDPSVKTTGRATLSDKDTVRITFANAGTARGRSGVSGFAADVPITAGSFLGVASDLNTADIETLCTLGGREMPCSERRANLLRISTETWRPGSGLSVALRFASPPSSLQANTITNVDDGRSIPEHLNISLDAHE